MHSVVFGCGYLSNLQWYLYYTYIYTLYILYIYTIYIYIHSIDVLYTWSSLVVLVGMTAFLFLCRGVSLRGQWRVFLHPHNGCWSFFSGTHLPSNKNIQYSTIVMEYIENHEQWNILQLSGIKCRDRYHTECDAFT
jgi:hypothetical protein